MNEKKGAGGLRPTSNLNDLPIRSRLFSMLDTIDKHGYEWVECGNRSIPLKLNGRLTDFYAF